MPSSPDLPGLLGEGSWPSSPLQPSSELPGTQGVLVAKTALEDGQRALCCTPSSPPGLVRGLRSLRGSSAQPELVGQVPAPRSGVFAPPSGSDLQPPPPPRPTLATRPWAAVTLSMQTRAAPGPPRLTPQPPPPHLEGPPETVPSDSRWREMSAHRPPPSCWPATRQHTHSTCMCTPCSKHRVERSCRDPQANILHPPRESWCRGCFSGQAGAGVGA